MMDRTEILETANDLISGDRAKDYGDVHDNFAAIAAVWTWHLEHPVTAWDVAQMMTLMKLARTKSSPLKADNYIDACGYQAIAAELVEYPVMCEMEN